MTSGFAPMAFELETERLVLNMWEVSDAASYRRLIGERGVAMPTLDAARSKIISGRAWDDGGELVWNVREL